MSETIKDTKVMTTDIPQDDFPTREGDLSKQWEWHQSFRDAVKNQYRSTYQDMVLSREVAVKSDYPSGYGGHVPKQNHDVLYKNTGLYDELQRRATSPNRDNFPSFQHQKDGVATNQAALVSATPSFGTLPDVRVQPPWAITPPIRAMPSHKTTPPAPTTDRK